MSIDLQSRQYAASLIRRHFEGTVTLDALEETFHGSEDPLVQRALELVYQQPNRGFLGVREQHWNKVYWPRVLYILEQLEAGETGVLPPAPLYPVATPLRIFGVLLLVLWCFAVSAEGAFQLYRHAAGAHVLSKWGLFKECLDLVVFGFLAVTGIGGLRYRIWLFRQWRGAPPIRFAAYTGQAPANEDH